MCNCTFGCVNICTSYKLHSVLKFYALFLVEIILLTILFLFVFLALLQSCSRIVDTVNESWDPDADARLNAKAILGRLQTFRQELNLPSELSKESGFLSSGQSLSSPLNNRPAPASPSCDSSVTLSPSEIKPAACYLTSPNMGFSAPPNMDLCDMPQGGSASSGEREHRRAPLSGGLHCSAPLSSDEDQPPPYQQLAPLSHEPKQLNRAFLPKEIETTI